MNVNGVESFGADAVDGPEKIEEMSNGRALDKQTANGDDRKPYKEIIKVSPLFRLDLEAVKTNEFAALRAGALAQQKLNGTNEIIVCYRSPSFTISPLTHRSAD